MANSYERNERIARAILDDAITATALEDAERETMLRHKKLGEPIAAWRDGKFVLIPPEEIDVDDDLGNPT